MRCGVGSLTRSIESTEEKGENLKFNVAFATAPDHPLGIYGSRMDTYIWSHSTLPYKTSLIDLCIGPYRHRYRQGMLHPVKKRTYPWAQRGVSPFGPIYTAQWYNPSRPTPNPHQSYNKGSPEWRFHAAVPPLPVAARRRARNGLTGTCTAGGAVGGYTCCDWRSDTGTVWGTRGGYEKRPGAVPAESSDSTGEGMLESALASGMVDSDVA